MSIFDLYDNLDKSIRERKVKSDFEEYNFNHDGDMEIGKPRNQPIWIFYLLTLMVASALIAQLLHLQISQGSFNRILAQSNRVRVRQVEAPRGIIYDKSGKPFVQNLASYRLEIYPLDLPKSAQDKATVIDNLSTISQIPANDIKNALAAKSSSSSDPVVLKDNIDRDTALLLKVKTNNLAGVSVEVTPTRQYLNITGMSPILGYVGKGEANNVIGKDGIEKSYENDLAGRDGTSEIEVDSQGREQRIISEISPTPGNSLTLTIDQNLEQVMADSLSKEMTAVGATAGSVVAINPQNGAVLGMVSLPTYNNNQFSNGISDIDYQKLANDPLKPLFNRAVNGTYPSGSTIKPFMASAGLQEGTITENTTINDTGEISVGNYTYKDWKAHGLVNVITAIAESCDVFFYSVGGGYDKIKGLGVASIDKYLTDFGFGKPLGIDLPTEASGLVPTPDWKLAVKKEAWYLGDTYHLSIGQGDFLVTPLQLANATAAIANGGKVYKPYIVSQTKDSNNNIVHETSPTILSQNFISPENIQIVQAGMREAVTTGTARQFSTLSQPVAAKTGTAQFGDSDKTHAWMTAYGPYNKPTISLAVIIEGGGEGYAAAGPVVKDILSWYFANN